ncbi:hypothetical protein EVG20_g11342 [Dentipellis fragilis]|uniref:Uncharacterized protein n=1 Tax=Dentipellis fragilis TaxID=205917 RepID=A0A4Y9XL39_9AGAM|nr:hypothetical protein EVG20_g11342 [Dentipellis fragilis]
MLPLPRPAPWELSLSFRPSSISPPLPSISAYPVSSSSLSWSEYPALARVASPIPCIRFMIGLDSCQRRRYRSKSKAFYRFAPTCHGRPSPDRAVSKYPALHSLGAAPPARGGAPWSTTATDSAPRLALPSARSRPLPPTPIQTDMAWQYARTLFTNHDARDRVYAWYYAGDEDPGPDQGLTLWVTVACWYLGRVRVLPELSPAFFPYTTVPSIGNANQTI